MKVETTGTQDDVSIQQLQEEHRRYSEKLDGLSHSPYLSAEEQIEEVRLKKLKLRVKDEMMGHRPFIRFN
ncbi:hypothetical protein ACPOL_5577 [Acidisarcina polymorpha]|uniref:DUF465 domain-containing protein n=1 Tax=Acidisarcina polymorpha TaxID=2211140 RepID=A0A2Z5G847_9BACT|nr:DUF465 domain-containing protein [Acidisarcina polymorpha]AXC14825.1 hypothetical protein ACPOL_5577 [Acidisarcina polymorpha]